MHGQELAIEDNEDSKIGGITIWAIGVGSAMGGVFFGWEFVLYGGFYCGLTAVIYAALFYWVYAQIITELSMRYRSTGGSFDYVMAALGTRAAIVIAIMNVMKLICANAATALAISSYLTSGGLPYHLKFLIWLGIYSVFTALDCIGIRQSATIQVLATLLCIGIIIFYVISSFTMFDAYLLTETPFEAQNLTSFYLFFKGLPFAVQFFDGFEEIPLLMSYAKDPEVTMPRAIAGCYLTIFIIALCVLIAAAGATDSETLLLSDAPLMVGIEQRYGDGSWVAVMMAYLIVAGLLVNFFAFVVFSSQQLQAIAESGLAPRSLTYRDVKTGAPINSSLACMVFGLITTFSFAFMLGEDNAQDTLLMASIIPSMICYLLVLQCIVSVREIEKKKKIQGSVTRTQQQRLGFEPGVFHISRGYLRARIAQVMCLILLMGMLMLACTSFNYIYGLLVFSSLFALGYMIMIHGARADIKDEELTAQQEEENLQKQLKGFVGGYSDSSSHTTATPVEASKRRKGQAPTETADDSDSEDTSEDTMLLIGQNGKVTGIGKAFPYTTLR